MYCYLLATSFGVSPASFVMSQSAPISINHCKQWICPCAAAEGMKVYAGQLHTTEVFQTYDVPLVSLFDMPEARCTKRPRGDAISSEVYTLRYSSWMKTCSFGKDHAMMWFCDFPQFQKFTGNSFWTQVKLNLLSLMPESATHK